MCLELWGQDHCEREKTLSESYTKALKRLCFNNELWF